MAVATTVVFELITALLAKTRANATLTANNVLVIDGGILTDVSRPNILFVGAQPSDEQGTTADATFEQHWGELGARARQETVTVACELWVRDGSSDLAARRTKVQELLAAIETDLRTDFSLGITRLLWCHIGSADLRQAQTDQGSFAAVPFVVAGRARLASQ